MFRSRVRVVLCFVFYVPFFGLYVSFVFYLVFLFFCLFSFGHCIVCPAAGSRATQSFVFYAMFNTLNWICIVLAPYTTAEKQQKTIL